MGIDFVWFFKLEPRTDFVLRGAIVALVMSREIELGGISEEKVRSNYADVLGIMRL